MVRDEDVIKPSTGAYMKPHERVLYRIALVFGFILAIAGIAILVASENFTWGIILLVAGVLEMIGVGLLLWTEGEKK